MLRSIVAATVLLPLSLLTGCLRQFVPAPFGTPLDDVCNPMTGELSVPLDTFRVGAALVPVTKGWTARYETAQDLNLTRIDGELNVWQGQSFAFPAIAPRSAVRCTISRGDATISIQATRIGSFNYRVDVSFLPAINNQFFYMQMQTRYVEHLRTMRGMVEAVRFPVDTSVVRKQ
jgi:hypothetical protein